MKLLILDVEGTLFKTQVRLPGTILDSTIWQAIAKELGSEAVQEEIRTHELWRKGHYTSYLQWVKDSISIHQKYRLSADIFYNIIANSQYNNRVIETLTQIDRKQYELIMISGGFRELTVRAQRDIKIKHAFAACEYQFDANGILESFNLLPCDFEGKIDFIKLMLKEYRLGSNDWVFVGDGANDVPIALQAPISIGYRPHPELKKAVTFIIQEFSELIDIIKSI